MPPRTSSSGTAVAWLKAELEVWSKLVECAKPEEAATIAFILQHWQEDGDLAGFRDAAALDLLPADEQRAVRALGPTSPHSSPRLAPGRNDEFFGSSRRPISAAEFILARA